MRARWPALCRGRRNHGSEAERDDPTDGFVPLGSLPTQEQLPAAPLLITAYAFVWVLLMAYLWSIAKRLGKVEGDIQSLQRRGASSSGSSGSGRR